MNSAVDRARLSNRDRAEEQPREIFALLQLVERQSNISQRQLANELGVALGLVNSYLKRCVKKGLIKVRQVPSRRYAYFLTPQGLIEKSRLTAEYLSWSMTIFRRARAECGDLLTEARRRGWRRVGLAGGSDIAEVFILSAADCDVRICVLVDAHMTKPKVLGVPVAAEPMSNNMPDGWIITSIDAAQATYDAYASRFGERFVLSPPMLAVRQSRTEAVQ